MQRNSLLGRTQSKTKLAQTILSLGPKLQISLYNKQRWLFLDHLLLRDFGLNAKIFMNLCVIIVRFYTMLKIPADYDRDTSPEKLTDNCSLSFSLLHC
jgi:hypothetical protein